MRTPATVFTIGAILACAALPAGAPAGFVIRTGSEMAAYADKLAPKIDKMKIATDSIAAFKDYNIGVIHREGDGMAEVHELKNDIFFVESGEATLIVGGTVPGLKTTAPNELRGAKIEGGERYQLSTGAVVHIPAKIPHQLLIAPGKQINYVAVKVE